MELEQKLKNYLLNQIDIIEKLEKKERMERDKMHESIITTLKNDFLLHFETYVNNISNKEKIPVAGEKEIVIENKRRRGRPKNDIEKVKLWKTKRDRKFSVIPEEMKKEDEEHKCCTKCYYSLPYDSFKRKSNGQLTKVCTKCIDKQLEKYDSKRKKKIIK